MNEKTKSLQLIQALSNADGAPGFEQEVTDLAAARAASFASCTRDSFNNLYITPAQGNREAPVLMVDGHSDEVAVMIQSVDDRGLLKFLPLGGWRTSTLDGQKMRMRNRNGDIIRGTISCKPSRYMSSDEQKAAPSLEMLRLDVGARSRKEVKEDFLIDLGMPAIPDTVFSYDEKRDLMLGKAFDNRLGCALTIEICEEAARRGWDHVQTAGVLSAQEELGLRGAQITSRRIKPDFALILEAPPADDYYLGSRESQSAIKKGPQLRFLDRCMLAHPGFCGVVQEVAEKHAIPLQLLVKNQGGTDAGAVHLSRYGVPAVVLSVPVRHAHTPQGFASYEDYAQTRKLALQVIEAMKTSSFREKTGTKIY